MYVFYSIMQKDKGPLISRNFDYGVQKVYLKNCFWCVYYNVRINGRMVSPGSFLQGLMGVTDYGKKIL